MLTVYFLHVAQAICCSLGLACSTGHIILTVQVLQVAQTICSQSRPCLWPRIYAGRLGLACGPVRLGLGCDPCHLMMTILVLRIAQAISCWPYHAVSLDPYCAPGHIMQTFYILPIAQAIVSCGQDRMSSLFYLSGKFQLMFFSFHGMFSLCAVKTFEPAHEIMVLIT